LPFTLLRNVSIGVPLPPAKRRAIDALPYGTNAKLMIGYDTRVWRAQGANGATMSDLAYQTTWETTRKQGGTRGVLTNFTGGAHGIALGDGTARMQAERATANLDRVFPGIAAARKDDPREARFHWPSHPWSLGSYACFGPGDWSTLRGPPSARRLGRCSSRASTARPTRRASWKVGASRARWPPTRSWLPADSGREPRFCPFRRGASGRSPDAFCTHRYRFAVQRAIAITIPSRSARIPTWGREQARNRFVRGGLFICSARMS
jgi:hypothetical protein